MRASLVGREEDQDGRAGQVEGPPPALGAKPLERKKTKGPGVPLSFLVLIFISSMRPTQLLRLREHSRDVCGVDVFPPLGWPDDLRPWDGHRRPSAAFPGTASASPGWVLSHPGAGAFPGHRLCQRVPESDLSMASRAQRNRLTQKAYKSTPAWVCGQATQLESSPNRKEKHV